MNDTATGKPRVLVLATTMPVVPDDGTPQFVLDLSIGLQQTFDVCIITPRVGASRREEVIQGVAVRRFAYFPRRWESLADGAILPNIKARPLTALQAPFLLAAHLWAALRIGRRWRPDMIHAHWLLPGGLIGFAAAKLLSIPYIVTVHGADAFAMQGAALQWLKRVVMRNARVVGLTSAALAEAVPSVPSVPQPIIPMGVDVEAFAAGVGERAPVAGRLLFVGRLAQKKGVDVLLRALADLDNGSLAIAGDGPDERELRALTEQLGLGDRVTFLGRVSRAQLREELRRAFAVVVPSRVASDGDQDTTPLVMSESMSAAVPVIASRLGGLGEQIEHGVTGLLAEPDSVSSLAAVLREAVADPESTAKLGLVAQERIRGSVLDIRSTTARYTEILSGVRSGL